MTKLAVFFALTLLLSVTSFAAQDPPEFKMPCAEVVKLGLDKFMDVYGEKTNGFSTYGMKQGLGYYIGCKRAANDDDANNLPLDRRLQVNVIRDTLTDIGSASWGNAYIESGGGTIYGVASSGAFAVREDLMASVIAAMATGSDGRARRRAKLALGRARRALPRVSQAVDLEHWDEASRAEQLKRYRDNVNAIRNGFTKLEEMIRLLPDRAADIVAHRLEAEILADLQG
ncbi:MAG TPA: hypothetical protein VJU84_06240 [Pyrinomonadaceae bacterium]|nr:hypothetical protein [Pyrinomonadaceae bacterium]